MAGLSIPLHQTGTGREKRQAGDVVNAQTFHQQGSVAFHRLDAQVQPRGDLLGAMALGDQLQDLPLARCKQLPPSGQIDRPDPPIPWG